MAEGDDPQVRQAIVRLLLAEKEFTRAYVEWSHSPVEIADRRRVQLDRAERALTRAQHEASLAQSHVHEE